MSFITGWKCKDSPSGESDEIADPPARAICTSSGEDDVSKVWRLTLAILLCGQLIIAFPASASAGDKAVPLVIGETFTIDSRILGETRRINVYAPPAYTVSPNAR